MTRTALNRVPILSMEKMNKAELSQSFGESFEQFGFAMVRDHGMDQDLIEHGWQLIRELFAMPTDIKNKYDGSRLGGQRGYTAFGVEIAKGASENDLKEFWHIGREMPVDDPLSKTMAPNVWPIEIPEFQSVFTQLYKDFNRVGVELLSSIAIYLGLDDHWFDTAVDKGNSILRLLHYPPVSPLASGVRAGAHEDINLITLLLGAEEGGLELKNRDDQWIPVVPPKGALAINVGDMLQRLTNHRLPSTTHRVVNPPAEQRNRSRYSMPFFLHLRPDFLIDALPQCVDAEHPRRDIPITAHDYLMERLREIGLITN